MSDEKNHYGSGIAIAAGALLAIYLLCPMVFLVPLFAAEEHHWLEEPLGERINLVVFVPIGLLAARFPAYERMINAEADFCRRHGLSP